LCRLQDRCIRDAIALQEAIGLQVITDGEYRRASFVADFIGKLSGARAPGPISTAGEGERFVPRAFEVYSRLERLRPIELDAFRFLKRHTSRTAKQTLPSPTMLLRGGRASVDRTAYPDLDEFHADVVRVYREELADLAAAGCAYVQLDDTNYAYLCDPALREAFRAWGYDPSRLAARFASLINAVISPRPAGMTVGIHICRGNSSGRWAAQGGYEPVAESLFNELDVDAYFLEYDDARSGGFEPLRFYPRGSGKKVVLGLVSTKNPEVETGNALKSRIDAAARFVPLEHLCLSPQCGFASTYKGNPISEDVQRRKLARVVEVAAEVWAD